MLARRASGAPRLLRCRKRQGIIGNGLGGRREIPALRGGRRRLAARGPSAPGPVKPNEPAAPDERRASTFRRKPKEDFQPVFPRFFQKRQGGGAERRQWRKKRGGSPVSKGVEGSRLGGDAQRPLRTAGAERRQWRKKRGGSPVSKGVEGCRLGGDAQRPLRTARGAEPPKSRKTKRTTCPRRSGRRSAGSQLLPRCCR